jgi:deferrochelatase/peroxidase EfeB
LLPAQTFARDELQEAQTGGDICLQICADDEQVAFHAARNLIRMGKGVLVVRHMQKGFLPEREPGNTSAPRNLFGFKDGSANLNAGDANAMNQHVWVSAEDPGSVGWMTGGSYLAYRQFSFRIETWDRSSLAEQEQIFGRDKQHGAPLNIHRPTAQDEFATPDLTHPSIDKNSHMSLAHSSRNGGAKILRRAYNFSNGMDPLGRINAGLLFISFQRSLADQFVPIQTRLAASDLMNEYVVTTGSGYFAVPKAPKTGSYWGAEFL